jgi:hypothetical protein
VSGSHGVVRWFRNTAQQLSRLVLLSSVRGIWCGLGGSSVRSTADLHRPALSHTHYAYKACRAPTHTRTQHVRCTHTHTTCACHMHTRAQRTHSAYTHHLPAKVGLTSRSVEAVFWALGSFSSTAPRHSARTLWCSAPPAHMGASRAPHAPL